MRRWSQTAIFLACVFFSVTAAYNVMSDNIEVERMATEVACGDQGATCRAQKASMSRTPFAQVFEYVTPKRTVGVRCTRAFVMVGEYACVLR
jgi:hypothetical protein